MAKVFLSFLSLKGIVYFEPAMKFYFTSISFLFLLACNSESKSDKKDTETTTTTTASPASDTGSIIKIDSADLKVKLPEGKDSAKALALKFNLPKGKNYGFEFDINMKQEGGQQNMNSKMQMGYKAKVMDVRPDERVLQVTYDKVIMDINLGGISQRMSSESETTVGVGPMQFFSKVMRAFKGKSFLMTVSNEGEIKSVTGFDAMVKEVTNELGLPPEAKDGMVKNISETFNDRAIKESFGQIFSIFPSTPVKVGDTWKKASLQSEGNAASQTRYTITNIEGNIVTIKAEADQQLDAGKAIAKNLRIMKVDARTGLVTNGNMSHKIIAEGREVATEIRVKGREL